MMTTAIANRNCTGSQIVGSFRVKLLSILKTQAMFWSGGSGYRMPSFAQKSVKTQKSSIANASEPYAFGGTGGDAGSSFLQNHERGQGFLNGGAVGTGGGSGR